MKRSILAKKISVLLTLGVFLTDTLTMAAAPILPDKNAPVDRQPLVMETANGVPLVQITAPTAGGVSRNQYTYFNVPDKGAILNNSYRMSQTELSGWVQGNNNMAKGAAKIIVNEVTSARPTSMNGFLEVAGNKASVVIANPNGITVNGGGFINTNRAILTTGVPVYDTEGSLKNFDVRKGQVLIEGNGLDGRKADSVAILSRAVKANAGLWANNLDIRTGANHVDANSYASTAIEEIGEKPDFALDIAAVGGMYAGRISMVGTEKGLGVNMAGTLSATEAVALDNAGNLSVTGTLYSAGNGNLKAATIENDNIIASGNDLSLEARESIQNRKVIGAGIDEKGNLTDAGTLSLTSKTITNDGSQILSGNGTDIAAETLSNTNQAEVYTGGNLTANLSNTLDNANGTINAGQSLSIQASGSVENTKGKLAAGGNLSIHAGVLNNEEGQVASDKNAEIGISHVLTNTKGSVTTGGNTSIEAGETTLDGILAAGGNLSLTAGSRLSNEGSADGYGVTKANGDVTIITENDLTNAKKIEAGRTLSISGQHVINRDTGELNGRDISIKAQTLKNTGLMSADGHFNAEAESLHNTENGRIYGDTITIDAAKLENRKNEALENQLETEMESLRKIENDLEAAFAVDVTGFTSDSQKTEYFSKIKTLTEDYASSPR